VALTVGATVFFRVEIVSVTGNSRYTQEEILAATGIQMGDNLYQLNKNQLSQQVLQSLPYTRSVSIRRSLPNAILITVTEWDAVAQIVPAQSDEIPEGETAAQEPWLISVGGKLLEQAPADSTAMTVTGLTPLSPEAGTKLTVPEEQQTKLSALLSLLEEMESQEILSGVSEIQLGDTQIKLRYLDRFDVKLPINGDFHYQLRVLQKGVEEINKRHGEQAEGTMDLTQKDYELAFSQTNG
jgi:cell division protein FtsQ